MGLFSFLNPITQPMGFKLGSGGPYYDSGKGDQMQGNVEKYLAQLAPIIAQLAEQAGIQNPMAPGGPQPENNDPYGLSPLQQSEVNQQASVDTEAYDQILSKVKANLAARGMADSSTMTAAEVYLKKQLQVQLGQQRVQAGQNAYQNKNQALQQIAGMLGTGFGAQQQVTDIQRQTAIDASSNAMSQLGSLLSLGMYGFGVGPFGNKSPVGNPTAPSGGVVQTPITLGKGTGTAGGNIFPSNQPISWGNMFGSDSR